MKKVLMCGNHPSNKGGMTSVISQMLSHDWKSEDIAVKFIPTFYPGSAVKKSAYFALSYFKILFSFIADKPDIVHMHMSYRGSFQRKYLIHRLCKAAKIKDVIHLHGSEFEKWFNTLKPSKQNKVRRLLRECDAFIVLGDKWSNVIKKIEPQTSTVIVNNAVKIPEETVKWNDDCCNILYMGVLIPRKGLFDLLNALLLLKQQNKLSGKRVIIAGTGADEKKLKEYCEENGLLENVVFAGQAAGEEKTRLLRESQVTVLPSYNEGLPISILEAVSYGMPVVSTDVGDISAAVHNGVNGYLIQPGDTEALAEKLNEACQKERFVKMSVESRSIAETAFSDEIFFNKIISCYSDLT